VKIFDSLLWTIGGKRKRRYYDSQLSFNESKPGSMGKPWGRNCHCEVNGKQLKIITEPNVQGQLVLKKGFLPYFVLICMRRNGIKNVLLANGTSAVICKKDADGYFGL
jgi:acetyl-CoA synthetase